MNQTESFCNSILDLFERPIPGHVTERAQYALLDYLAVTIAGTAAFPEKLRKYAACIQEDCGNSTALGMGRTYPLKEAVFLNGLNGHALDYDDGTNEGIIHLGTPIFSVLLPLAEKHHIPYARLLKAAVIGYETSFTMASSIQPRHKQLGYHATGTCGVLGIAMAGAYLLDFTQDEAIRAFQIACASASGMLQVLDSGSELKPYNAAKTAVLGLTSLQMAKAGFRGNSDALGSYRGFLKMMTGDEATVCNCPISRGTYAIEKAYTKPYAACRYCHPAIDCAIILSKEHRLSPDSIRSIYVDTYSLAVSGHDHSVIPNSSSAKMSIPYSVACGILYRKAGLQEYDRKHVENPQVIALANKVTVRADAGMSARFPALSEASVRVEDTDGKIYEAHVNCPKGEPETRLSPDEFRERFQELMAYGGKNSEISSVIYDRVMDPDCDPGIFLSLLQ